MKVRRFRSITLTADIVILAMSFLIMAATKPSGLKGYIPTHGSFFAGLAVIWLTISLINGKMHRGKIINYRSMFNRVIGSNIVALSLMTLLMYTLRQEAFSRTIVLGTGIVATIIELVIGTLYISYKKADLQNSESYSDYSITRKKSELELVKKVNGNGNGRHAARPEEVNPKVLASIEREAGKEMAEAILEISGTKLNNRTAVLSTTTVFNITSLPGEKYDYIINLRKINDIPYLNEFLDEVSSKLGPRGLFLCCVETKDQRKARIMKKYPPGINVAFYSFDFVLKRILPKLKYTQRIVRYFTNGSNKVLSRAEALGRLSRAGFMINQETFVGNRLCIEGVKICEPLPVNGTNYGPLIALPRIGRNGEIIKVYKLRTMHPYSEYIQDYVYQQHDLRQGGKFSDDFRITSWGGVARKIWLDEFPMFINLFKGDMKFVGVRPLSQQYFELYSDDLKKRRIRFKPGLIPPFYADMPSDLREIQESEMKYLDQYERSPVITDMKYLVKSGWNIMFRHARSN